MNGIKDSLWEVVVVPLVLVAWMGVLVFFYFDLVLSSWRVLVRDAVVGFAYWTLVLSPVMLWVVKLDLPQFLSWLCLQAVLGPPLGALSAWVFRRVNGS